MISMVRGPGDARPPHNGGSKMAGKLQAHLMADEGDVASYVLLPGDPGRVLRIGGKMDCFKEVAFNREFRTITGKYKGIPITVTSSGIGGPSTAIALEELANLGAKVVIRVGSCGAYSSGIEVGDVVIPVGAVKEDGTSKAYVPSSYPAVPNPRVLFALVKAAKDLSVSFHVGIVLSHDVFYMRNRESVKFWNQRGVIAADMESACVLTVGRMRGLQAGAVLAVVSACDEVFQPWVGVKDYATQTLGGAGKALFGEEKAILIALRAIVYLEKEKEGLLGS